MPQDPNYDVAVFSPDNYEHRCKTTSMFRADALTNLVKNGDEKANTQTSLGNVTTSALTASLTSDQAQTLTAISGYASKKKPIDKVDLKTIEDELVLSVEADTSDSTALEAIGKYTKSVEEDVYRLLDTSNRLADRREFLDTDQATRDGITLFLRDKVSPMILDIVLHHGLAAVLKQKKAHRADVIAKETEIETLKADLKKADEEHKRIEKKLRGQVQRCDDTILELKKQLGK